MAATCAKGKGKGAKAGNGKPAATAAAAAPAKKKAAAARKAGGAAAAKPSTALNDFAFGGDDYYDSDGSF